MSDYTELVLKCMVKKEIPKEVDDVLKYLFNDLEDKPDKLPEHKYFKYRHWDSIGNSCSCYHIPKAYNFFDDKYLFSRSDVRGYEGNIKLFVEWLMPYVKPVTGNCIGWIWYEYWDTPELITWSEAVS